MQVVRARPPNFDEIAAAIPEARGPNVIFCYGTTIYAPDGGNISAALRAHEAVHSARQGKTDEEIRAWWRKYIADTRFRLDEELPAHQAEYTAFCEQERGKGRRIAFLDSIAHRLSGPLYGGLVDFATAKRLIKYGR